MSDVKSMIEAGKTSLGIEFGSTRIKAVLVGEDNAPIASGSHEWENRLDNGVWTYTLEDIWTGLQDSYKKMTEDEIEETIRKNFKMKGLIIADVKIIKMNDNTLKTGNSKLVPAALTTSGTINEKWTNGVKAEEFRTLQEYIYKTIKDISKEILSGNIDLKPYYKKGKTPCQYCEYKAVCGFNSRQENNTYNYIEQKSKDEILLKMKKNLEE